MQYIQNKNLHERLRPYVAKMFVLTGDASTPVPSRVIPSGRLQILINFFDTVECVEGAVVKRNRPRATIIGPRTRFSTFRAAGVVKILGIEFKEHAAFRFFRAPLAEFTGESVDWSDLWPGDEIVDRVAAAASHRGRFRIVERALLAKVDEQATVTALKIEACLRLIQESETITIEEIAMNIGLTGRHVQRLFRDYVGLSPMTYMRITRIERAARLIAGPTGFNGLDFALENGFYDQAHFNRDFKSIVGLSPTRYADELAGRA